MKETKKQIVEQTRQRVAAEYKKVIAAKDGMIDRLRNKIHLQQVKVDHQADHITQLTETLHLIRGDPADKADSLDDITLRPGATVTLPLPQPQGEPKPLLMALDWRDADLVRLVLREKIGVFHQRQNGFMADPEQRRLASAIERMTKIYDYINELQQKMTKDK